MRERFEDRSRLTVVDIGAKDFFLASLLSRYFHWKGEPPHVIGIEVDGYRRYQNLQTRASLGKANAAYIPHGEYRVMDFLQWEKPIDIAVLFGPFVTEKPLLGWGLPRSFFQPQALFQHVARTLSADGILFLSCPTEEEFDLSHAFAQKAGLVQLERKDWKPQSIDSGRNPVFGAVFGKRVPK